MLWTVIVLVLGVYLGSKYQPKFFVQNNKNCFSYKNSNKIRVTKELF